MIVSVFYLVCKYTIKSSISPRDRCALPSIGLQLVSAQ